MRLLVRCLAAIALLASAIAAAPSALAAGNTVTVVNGGAPGWVKFDTNGNGLDAHDGEIKEFFGKYYLYGTSYGCGYVRGHSNNGAATPFCGFVVYESTDLRHWKYDRKLFDPSSTTPTDWQKICNSATPSCYRPHVLYDFAKKRFVLWVNTYDTAPDGTQHGYHVLVTDGANPAGPFHELTNSDGTAALPWLSFPTGGDFDLYQDTDHAGYIVYTVRQSVQGAGSRSAYHLVVERLNSTYTGGTGLWTGLTTGHTEAPSMFRRGADYYITMADPYCAYCAGTGTAYLRAKSPLGPWRGLGGNVAASRAQMYVDGLGGLFQGSNPDPTVQSQLANLDNYDFIFQARPLPDTNLNNKVHYGRIGWMFRAQNTGNGYLWVLSNKPYTVTKTTVNKKTKKKTTTSTTYPATLYKEILKNGQIAKISSVPVKYPVSLTAMNNVRTRVLGNNIYTYLEGHRIDLTVDGTYPVGYAGVRERGGDSAYYDNFYLSRPGFLGYQLFLSDSFDYGSLAQFPSLNRFLRHGVQISSNSCGGQPDDVAQLRAPVTSANPTGMEFLYQSDRWDSGDQNEAQATQYWEPLKFNADGSIKALACGAAFHTVLASATASPTTLDRTRNGLDGFIETQDITAGHSRGQTFQVTANGQVSSIALTLFQGDDSSGNGPNADLTLSLYDYDRDPGLLTPIAAPVTIARSTLSWAPSAVTVPISAAVAPNPDGTPHHYAFVLSTTSTSGVYGTARTDGHWDQYKGGAALVQVGDPTAPSWSVEGGNDLRFTVNGVSVGS